MTDHVTPNKARELAGTLDLTQYAEHSDALMSLAAQVEELRADLAIEEQASADLYESQKVLLARAEELARRLKRLAELVEQMRAV